MNMSNKLDGAISVAQKSGSTTAAFAGTSAVGTLGILAPAVEGAHGLKGALCGLEDMRVGVGPDTGIVGLIGYFLGLVIYLGLALPIPFVILGSLGAFQTCCAPLRIIRRFPLAFGTIVASMAFYAAIMYTLFFPLSLVVTDLCTLMDNIQTQVRLSSSSFLPGGRLLVLDSVLGLKLIVSLMN